jgi:lipopolysaccharide/colanic/teichoic acid biosynthesis glycosyltransferase
VIRRHHSAFLLSLMVVDALAAMATFAIVSTIRFGAADWHGSWSKVGLEAPVVMALFAIAWVGVLGLGDLYRLRARWSFRREVLDIVQAGALLAVVTFSMLFVLKLPAVSRLFLLWLFPAQVAVTVATRLGLRWAFRLARARGVNTRYVLMVGVNAFSEEYAGSIERHRELGLHVIGHLREGEAPPTSAALPAPAVAMSAASAARPTTASYWGVSRPVLGTIDQIEDVLHSRVVDEVVVCLPPPMWGYIAAIADICRSEGKIVRIPVVEGFQYIQGSRAEEFDGLTVLSFVNGPDRVLSLIAKRLLDVAVSATALVLLLPVFAIVALAQLAFEGRPILFAQRRVGLHGREFAMLKFRSMVPDAEARLEDLLQHNEVAGPAFKLSRDPRLTGLGRFLRRTSIDELPQIWNVLRGDMSLVGPRPALPREVAAYDVWHRRRLSMKPGITGLWQVSARRDPEFDRWVRLDLDYIDRWSVWLDIKLLLRTVPAMFQGR